MPREILVDWTTPAGGGFRSVLYFAESEPFATQRSDLGDLLDAIGGVLDQNVSWLVETAGREMDSLTGTLTGVWTDTTPFAGTGGTIGQSNPDAAQLLIRWNTQAIVDGRFLKGRTFIPGVSTTSVTDGNVSATTLAGLQTAVNTFVGAFNGFGVWHRPTAGAGGSFATAQTGSIWSEYAILRRRRA